MSVLFAVAACLGLTGTAPAMASPAPAHEKSVAQAAAPGSDCTGYASANRQSNGTVNMRWEIYCTQRYYHRINVAPVLNRGGTTFYFQKDCISNDGVSHCVFTRNNFPNPAGTQRWFLSWDPSSNGSGVYWAEGGKNCIVPNGIYCSNFSANW